MAKAKKKEIIEEIETEVTVTPSIKNEEAKVEDAAVKNTEEEEIKSEERIKFEALLKKYNTDYRKSIFEYCFLNNIPYSEKIFKKLYDNELSWAKFPEIYVDTIKEDIKYKDIDFLSQLSIDGFEKIYNEKEYSNSLTEEDRKNRQIVIEVFSYDPFISEPEIDKPQLYRDLAGLSNEAMRKDVAKQKAAISIVRSYGNIEKYQRKVAELTSSGDINEETQKLMDQYLTLISKIQTNINQTAEKNNFTVKGIGSNGRGMLSDVLAQIDERGIDEGVTNFYDISTSKSIEEIANISMKAQMNQISLSKTDYVDILNEQCNLVIKAQKIAKDAQEALRLAKYKIKKQELIDELEEDYRKKGISEEEIKDFISREYNLYTGDDAL